MLNCLQQPRLGRRRHSGFSSPSKPRWADVGWKKISQGQLSSQGLYDHLCQFVITSSPIYNPLLSTRTFPNHLLTMLYLLSFPKKRKAIRYGLLSSLRQTTKPLPHLFNLLPNQKPGLCPCPLPPVHHQQLWILLHQHFVSSFISLLSPQTSPPLLCLYPIISFLNH